MRDLEPIQYSCKQPEYATLPDCYVRLSKNSGDDSLDLRYCSNGFQSTGVDLPLHMYDLLKDLLNDPRVIEHYESQRNLNKGAYK